MKTVTQFIKAHHITMKVECADSNPNFVDAQNMDHWKCKIRRPGAQLTTYFSQGYGHNGREPKLESVLDCLSMDARSVEFTGFEEWCQDMGYDNDSRKAEKIYKACERQATKLEKFLGADLYNELLHETEED